MPATVKSSVGSCGIRLAEGTTVCALSPKNDENDERNWSALRGEEDEEDMENPCYLSPSRRQREFLQH